MGKHSRTEQAQLAESRVALRLKALSEEAAHLASTLSQPVVEGGFEREARFPRRRRRLYSPQEVLRLVIEIRRSRSRHFRAALFADPAWDILLDLMSWALAGRRVTVTSLCIAADVPTTTALRWVNELERAGLLDRLPDPNDRRRVLVELTPEGKLRMDDYLRGVRRLIERFQTVSE